MRPCPCAGWDFSALSMSPCPSPSPKWLQLSGPQIGTAGMGLARCPPPSRVCLRERKPAHLWNPSLSPRSLLPPVPGERGVSRCSVSLPSPSRITMRVVFSTLSALPAPPAQTNGPAACLRALGLPVPLQPPPLLGSLISVKVLRGSGCSRLTCCPDTTEGCKGC